MATEPGSWTPWSQNQAYTYAPVASSNEVELHSLAPTPPSSTTPARLANHSNNSPFSNDDDSPDPDASPLLTPRKHNDPHTPTTKPPTNSSPAPSRRPTQRFWHHIPFTGWRVGVTWCALAASLVLLTNTLCTISLTLTHSTTSGIGTLQSGSCASTKQLSLWLHLLINVLGTILLAGSNYCMQVLSAPTRSEVDKAHARGKWLDIGVPSVRNLWYVGKWRGVIWVLLGTSGVPLHLLYNSAVFSTLAHHGYEVYGVAATVVEMGPETDLSRFFPEKINKTVYAAPETLNIPLKDMWGWERLGNKECVRAYGQAFISKRANVVVVTDALGTGEGQGGKEEGKGEESILFVGESDQVGQGPTYSWLCGAYAGKKEHTTGGCDLDALAGVADKWQVKTPTGVYLPAQYCLSQPVEEHCTVRFSVVIMCVVIVTNLVKVVCMLAILRLQRDAPLVTLGDAVQSFLNRNDPKTVGKCLADKQRFMHQDWRMIPQQWRKQRRLQWFSGASRARWLICNILCTLTLLIAGGLLALAIENDRLSNKSLAYLWKLGFGAVTGESITQLFYYDMEKASALYGTILVANSPQTILSFLFLTYNSLYTCMLLSQEWFDYARERKSLRVTDPVGKQRSTYRLQLPYKYGIPLVALSGLFHWLVSQSLFLVKVTGYDKEGQESGDYQSLTALGYSCIAIITVIILGSVTIITGIAMGFRRYKPGMPLAGSSSAAISAACHQPPEDVSTAQLPLLWGVAEQSAELKGDLGQADPRISLVGHCSFTSLPAVPPLEGYFYAGRSSQGRKRLELAFRSYTHNNKRSSIS